jgi:hypothetical protein
MPDYDVTLININPKTMDRGDTGVNTPGHDDEEACLLGRLGIQVLSQMHHLDNP